METVVELEEREYMSQALYSVEELEQRLKSLRPLFEAHPRVLGVFLFGSYVEGYATKRSDVDLAVLYDGEVDWEAHVDLAAAIEERLPGLKVDVLDARRLPLPLQYRVIKGHIVYERDPDRVSDFIEHVIVRYLDFLPDLQAFYREFDRSMEETYGV